MENQKILNERLREMVNQEQEAFRQDVLIKCPEEIYSMAQEIAVKEELAAFIKNTEFSAQAADAMLKAGNVLQNIYIEADSWGLIGEKILIRAVSIYEKLLVKEERKRSGMER